MAIIKSSTDHLTLNADGASKDIKFQANGVEKASISSTGAFTSTTIDATKLTGNLPAISGAALTGLGGKVLKVTTETNSTRAALSTSTDYTLWTTATFTKDNASSDLVVSAVLPLRGAGNDYSNGWFCSIDGTEKGTDGSAYHGIQMTVGAGSANGCMLISVNKTFSGIATGSHDIRFGWKSKSSSSTKPAAEFNPNSSDHSALHQMASHVTILEVE